MSGAEAAIAVRAALTVDGRPVAHRLADDGRTLIIAAAGSLTGLEARLLVDRVLPPDRAPAVYLVVDRLDAPDAGSDRYEYQPPETPAQEAVAQIWADALDVPRVGVDDDYLDLGGDSFAAVVIVDRMAQQCGLEVSAADLYQRGSVRSVTAEAAQEVTG
jgi:acyl carrier protein